MESWDSRCRGDLPHPLCAEVPGEAIYLDTPEPNAEAVALARRHGMVAVFETARI
ncbi:MAG: hypothetical protein AB7D01_01280 [Methanoculleus sp.]